MRARWKVLMDSRARSCCSSAYLTRYTYTSFFSCRRHKRQTQINSKALKSCVVIIIKQYVISVTICLRRFRTNTAEEDLPEVTQTQTLTDEIMFQSFSCTIYFVSSAIFLPLTLTTATGDHMKQIGTLR